MRQHTEAAHRALERSLPIASPEPTRSDCAAYLRAMLGWLEPLESRLWTALPANADPQERDVALWAALRPAHRAHKARWLTADLRALGTDPDDIAALPRCGALPSIPGPGPGPGNGHGHGHGLARRLGIAYVVEGATLGGRVLARQLAPVMTPVRLAFFDGYGADTGPMWTALRDALEHCASRGDAATADITDAAVETFESLHRWLKIQPRVGGGPR